MSQQCTWLDLRPALCYCLPLQLHCSKHFIDPLYSCHGPLTRYVKLRVAQTLGMLGTFSPLPRVSDPDMHHGTCVTHVSWCMLGSITSGFLWSLCWEKRSQHPRRMRNPQLYVSGKRSIGDPFSQMVYELKVKFCDKSFCSNWDSNDPHRSQFYTCHMSAELSWHM